MRLPIETVLRMSLGAALAGTLVACSPETAPAGSTYGQTAGSGPVGVAASGAPVATAGTPAAVGGGPVAGASAIPVPVAGAGSALPTGVGDVVDTSNTALPCDVSKVLAKNCGTCHGQDPIGGAPMSLTKYGDLMKPAVTNPSMKVGELTKLRLNDPASPMPPGATISAEDKTMLNGWLNSGMPAGTAADAACDVAVAPPTNANYPGLTPLPGETCYDFKVHNATDKVDDVPLPIAQGEHYIDFYYKAPWPDGTIATRYGSKLDNEKVLHHWLLFQTIENQPDGMHIWTPLPTLNGVQAQLLAGWAVGGLDLTMPEDVGAELPPKGTQLNIQWHFYNYGTADEKDMSSVQICTMPKAARKNTATITWVGTEDIGGNRWTLGQGMPAHQESTFSGTCNPLRAGMDAAEPIHIVAFWPHMHQLGTRMEAYVNHKNGMKEQIFDKPFDFNHQIHYMQNYDLAPGDTLQNVCHFNNTTNAGVPFGESSDTEMCYLFTFSYPAHALENHVLSLIGATNTCW